MQGETTTLCTRALHEMPIRNNLRRHYREEICFKEHQIFTKQFPPKIYHVSATSPTYQVQILSNRSNSKRVHLKRIDHSNLYYTRPLFTSLLVGTFLTGFPLTCLRSSFIVTCTSFPLADNVSFSKYLLNFLPTKGRMQPGATSHQASYNCVMA